MKGAMMATTRKTPVRKAARGAAGTVKTGENARCRKGRFKWHKVP